MVTVREGVMKMVEPDPSAKGEVVKVGCGADRGGDGGQGH